MAELQYTYPVYSDLSGKWRYPGFEQPGPGWELATPPPLKKK